MDEDTPDCSKCGFEPRLRPEYGCDKPVGGPCDPCAQCLGTGWRGRAVFSISCGVCAGEDPECPHCRRGSVPMYRCPKKLVDGRPDIVRAFNAAQRYPVLPGPGGYEEQTASYCAVRAVFESEENVIRTEQRASAERKARREKQRGF